jgi:hypothetical protein
VETAVNAVRAFIHVFHSHSLPCAFGLPGELTSSISGVVATTEQRLSIQFEGRKSFVPFELTDGVVQQLRQDLCFDELSRLAGTEWEALTSFERAVRVAFLWLGRSVIAHSTAGAFTDCAICLERLLIADDEETTVERFADRLAYLLAESADDRKYVHKTAKRLYDVRSRIVHAGFEAVEVSQLEEFESLAISALVKAAALLKDIREHSGLRDLLHDRKMS